MTVLITTINEITQFGLYPNLPLPNKEELLEKNLVKIYNLFFDIIFEFDETAYPEFDKTTLPDIRQNIISNFNDFGFYKTILNINDLGNKTGNAIGDAIDDLSDIITDLLEIKWRMENNSVADGLWYFQLIFPAHTQQHIIDLLQYLKQKNG